ncbi:MAG: tRNA pseudouridine(55) synthase TruB [Coriobacteriia bacterium]|nr:tRNA pseudouridine(55) synthase TruB [Coriobacteriia bacterium]
MSARRGASGLAGVLLVDKPEGPTSHDVVAAVRRASGEGRVGHAGTLDPMATGLLVVLVGPATRLERYLSGHDKTYEARIVFGTATDTLDAAGVVTATQTVPDAVHSETAAREILAGFVGPAAQLPPAFSAIKRDGVTAHRLARAGGTPDLEARPIVVHEAALLALDAEADTWDVRFTVSKGTYVRALARDIGEAVGTAAHLGALRRTRAGEADISDAHSVARVIEAAGRAELPDLFADPVGLLGIPVTVVDPSVAANGRPLQVTDVGGREGLAVDFIAVTDGHALLGIYRPDGDRLVPETILAGGVPL